jgi:hypothetical protein
MTFVLASSRELCASDAAGRDKVKILSRHTLLGQQGINIIERRVHLMGYWWYPSAVPEVGIDGHFEIRDSQTGRMTNLIVQVQSKATEQPWTREREDSFDFICDEDDLEYWLAGNAPVIIVFSRPSKDEAYWVSLKDYFRANPGHRKPRRISLQKSTSRFDQSAADALLRLAAPKEAGAYLSPRPKTEKLYSNLLRVASYAPDLHVARTDIHDFKDIWDTARELKVEIGPEWVLSDGNLMSFHDLSVYPWSRFCDPGTMETFQTSEWAESDDENRHRLFVRLVNHALKERLKEWRVWRRKSDGIYYFAASPDSRSRRIDFAGALDDQYRTVVQTYVSGKIRYIRHLAFGGYFERAAGAWYLEITPSYVFTTDGIRPYRFEADLLSGIKLLEHNDTLLSQLHLWVDLLTRPADLVHSDYSFLKFGELLDVCISYGINDKEWLSHEELDVGAEGLDALSKLPLLSQ